MNSNRPAIDSGLSVSRIGSNAQCRLMKVCSMGIKNELTNYRLDDLPKDSMDWLKLSTLNLIFYQDYLFISTLETSLVLLLAYRSGILINDSYYIHRLIYLLSLQWIYILYLLFVSKCNYGLCFYLLCLSCLSNIILSSSVGRFIEPTSISNNEFLFLFPYL